MITPGLNKKINALLGMATKILNIGDFLSVSLI